MSQFSDPFLPDAFLSLTYSYALGGGMLELLQGRGLKGRGHMLCMQKARMIPALHIHCRGVSRHLTRGSPWAALDVTPNSNQPTKQEAVQAWHFPCASSLPSGAFSLDCVLLDITPYSSWLHFTRVTITPAEVFTMAPSFPNVNRNQSS